MTRRARVIADDSGSALGVVVRILPATDTEATIRAAAVEALAAHGDECALRLSPAHATEVFGAMTRCRTDTFRWIPCDIATGYNFRIEDAEAGSRGSWLGRYWSYP